MPTSLPELTVLCALVFVSAVVYSSGGHAGASAYLAAMALFGVAPAEMKPTALVMNIVVATVGSVRFARAGAVPWNLLRWLCLGSIPASFLGGRIGLPAQVFQPFLGGLLVIAAARLWLPQTSSTPAQPPGPAGLVGIGAAIGFVAGLTGIGGGIFLSPIVILAGWEEPRRAGGAAVVFILVNSLLGLMGHLSATAQIPPVAGLLAGVALAGGLLGSWAGVNRLKPMVLRRVHSIVLVTSSVKLFLDGLR